MIEPNPQANANQSIRCLSVCLYVRHVSAGSSSNLKLCLFPVAVILVFAVQLLVAYFAVIKLHTLCRFIMLSFTHYTID
jgi:hypothetical protein